MKSLVVSLGDRSYPINIDAGLLDDPRTLSALSGRDVLAVSNETVAPLYLERLALSLSAARFDSVILPDGESFKTLDTLNTIFDTLLEKRFARDVVLIALGGGVVGDITGFAAASYQRGVEFVQIPTTLLAQVDSSVGGKTGVNHRLGKNMIGAFHQPRQVVIDIKTLDTLPERELSAGLAEVVKYGLISDSSFFDWLEDNLDDLLRREPVALSHAIHRSCEIKADIVSRDERESGQRALLNLGHTFGHALETGLGYGVWLHGEAVAVGMSLAVELSVRMGWLEHDALERVNTLLSRARLPVSLPDGLSRDRILSLMKVDKKVTAGRMRLVLLKSIGEGVVSSDFDQDALLETLTPSRHIAS